MPLQAPESLPDFVKPVVAALRPARRRSLLLCGGTDAVHAAGEEVLPKWTGEEPAAYKVRSTLTEVFDGYGRTLEAAVGLLFGAGLDIADDLPDALAVLDTDADGEETTLDTIGRRLATHYVREGVAAVLVDFPRVDAPGTLSVADVQAQALRPYLVPISAMQILSWREARRGAEKFLTQLVIAENVEVEVDAFGTKTETHYRIFRHDLASDEITVEVVKLVDQNNMKIIVVVQPMSRILGPDRIPLVCSPLTNGPPLDRLGWLNIGHYRVSADNRYLMSICHAPTLTITHSDFEDKTKVSIGPNAVMRLTGEQEASWLQADPNALLSSETTMQRISDQMAAIGMAFLSRDKASNKETATGRKMDSTADRATIGSLADAVSDVLTRALSMAGQYVGVTGTPEVLLVPDYDVARMDAPTILALSTLATQHQITLETLLTTLKAGNVLSDALDVEAEVAGALVARADDPALDTNIDGQLPMGSPKKSPSKPIT
jgi:hypothetical protein